METGTSDAGEVGGRRRGERVPQGMVGAVRLYMNTLREVVVVVGVEWAYRSVGRCDAPVNCLDYSDEIYLLSEPRSH